MKNVSLDVCSDEGLYSMSSMTGSASEHQGKLYGCGPICFGPFRVRKSWPVGERSGVDEERKF